MTSLFHYGPAWVSGLTMFPDSTLYVLVCNPVPVRAYLYKTEDAGTTWVIVDTVGPAGGLWSFGDTLYTIALAKMILRSYDGGVSWDTAVMQVTDTAAICDLCRLSDSLYYVDGRADVLRSEDGWVWEPMGWFGMWGLYETEGHTLVGGRWPTGHGENVGLYLSTDWGESWDTIREDGIWGDLAGMEEIRGDTLYEIGSGGQGYYWVPAVNRRYWDWYEEDAKFMYYGFVAAGTADIEEIGGRYFVTTMCGDAALYCNDRSDSSAFLWSSTYDVGYPAEWGEVSWDCENCEYIRVKVRTFDPSPCLDWGLCDYVENGEDISGLRGVHDGDRRVEYRVEFLSAPRDSLPVLREIRINYGELSVAERRGEGFKGVGIERVYPNPFRDKLRVVYGVRERGYVSVVVYDEAGRRVRLIEEGIREGGRYEVYWDGRDDKGVRVRSGVYFIRVRVGGGVYLRKVEYLGGVSGVGYFKKRKGEVSDMKWGIRKSLGAIALSAGMLYSASVMYPGVSVIGEVDGRYIVAFSADYYDSVSGMPLDEFSDVVNVSEDSQTGDMFPRVEVDGNGYQHIVFMKRPRPWSGLDAVDIYLRVLTPEGYYLFSNYWLTDLHDSVCTAYPDIALEPSEGDHVDAHIVWMDNRNGNWEIYYRKWRIYYEPGHYPEPLGPEVPVSFVDGRESGRYVDPDSLSLGPSGEAYYPERPVVAYEPNTQTVHTVWSDKRGGDWTIYYQKQTNDAVPTVLIDDKRISNDLYELHRRRILGEPGNFGGGAVLGGGDGVYLSVDRGF